MTGYVYAIADDHGRVKLGWSSDPQRRLVKARSDNGSKCELVGVVAGTREQERELHELLAPWRHRGEWFDCHAKAVAHFISFLRPIPARPQRKGMTKLDQYLAENNLSSPVFADQVGIAASTVWRLRRGDTLPDWETIRRIIAATGGAVTPNDFLPDAAPHEIHEAAK
jgi:hypothetical protein